MLFPNLTHEKIVQIDDKTRLNAMTSFITVNEVALTSYKINPDGSGLIDVTAQKYLDWSYSTSGTKTITVEIDNGTGPVSKDFTIEVISEVDDKLFSGDEDLVSHEPDILNYIPEGRYSFKNIHRASQDKIIDWLDEHRITDSSGDKLDKDNIHDIEEVRHWSKYLTLSTIFEGLSNSVDDIFKFKSDNYLGLAESANNRSQLRLELDKDGNVDLRTDLRTMDLSRA